MRLRKRPRLSLEMGHLGCVDPFDLVVREDPPGSGKFRVQPTVGAQNPLAVERAGLCIIGCSQALMDLSMRWFLEAQSCERGSAVERGAAGGLAPDGRIPDGRVPDGLAPLGEMRMVVRRREARLIGSLLRRHLGRLPQPPTWMAELLGAIEEMDEFLRWQAD